MNFKLFKNLNLDLGFSKAKIKDYSDLWTPVNIYSFASEFGSIGTLFQYGGMREQPINNEYISGLNLLGNLLKPYFKKPNHGIHFLYDINTNSKSNLSRMKQLFQPNYDTLKNIGLELHDIIDAKCELFKDSSVDISSYFVVWTIPIVRDNTSSIQVYPDASDKAKVEYPLSLLSQHKAMVQSVQRAFNRTGFLCDFVKSDVAITTIRRSFNPFETPQGYKPKITIKDMMPSDEFKKNESSYLFHIPPRLNQQVTPGRVVIHDYNVVTVGLRRYATCDIHNFPVEYKTYEELVSLLIETNIPVRISVNMRGGGWNHPDIRNKNLLAMLSYGMEQAALKRLNKYVKSGGVCVALQATLITWVDLTDMTSDEADIILNQNMQDLTKAVQGWGSTELNTKGIDPLEQYSNSIPGFRSFNTAPVSVPPIDDAMCLLPLYKSANVWNNSADLVFKTTLGQIYIFKRFSAKQNYNVTLITGNPGDGKSVMINDMILSLVSHPGLNSIPFIGIAEVKPSSWGALLEIKDSLPENMRNLVAMSKLYNSKEYCVNPNDLHYGARMPSKRELEFQTNFWALATQDIQNDSQSSEIINFIRMMLIEAHSMLDDNNSNGRPKIYRKGIDGILDRWMEDDGFKPDETTEYWAIFDFYHDRCEYKKAAYVQKFTSPTLSDLISVCNNNENLKQFYKDLKLANQTSIIDYMFRTLTNLQIEYPAFNSYTRMDFSNAKIIGLDLEPVAGNSDLPRAHKTAIFFMLAKEIISKKFLFNAQELENIDEKYHGYHNRIIKELQHLPKSLVLDEFHMTSMQGSKDLPAFTKIFQNEINSTIRVSARVYNIEFIIASQRPQDFTGDLNDLYTNVIIMGVSDNSASITCEIFGLNESWKNAFMYLGNPTANGSQFIMINKTKKGRYVNVLFNPIPAKQLWSTSTTREDVELREYLYAKISRIEARNLLVEYFPSGSARDYIESLASLRRVNIKKNSQSLTDIIGHKMLLKERLLIE